MVKVVIPIVGKDGEKYETVKIVEWKAKEGEKIKKGETICYIETEKASCDIEAEISGFLHILAQEDEKSIVGNVIGCIADSEEELGDLQNTPSWKLT